ncbi:MAG: glycosyltransferase family 4 protein, partial [Candidatus Hodarchaeota archaeon]
MKICILTSTFFPSTGGIEFYIHYLASFLTQRNQDIHVLAPKIYKGEINKFNFGYQIHRYFLPPRATRYFLKLSMMSKLIILHKKFKFDIFHAQMAYPSGYYATELRTLLRVPVVITCHAGDVQVLPELNYGIRLNPKIDKKVYYTLGKADWIISVSESVKKYIFDCNKQIKNVDVISPGVDTKSFQTEVDLSKKIEFNPKNYYVILSVGRNHPKKAYSDLIRALYLVKKEVPNIKCILVGNFFESLIPLISELNLKNEVLIAGNIPEKSNRYLKLPCKELISLYQISDVFVLPSLIEGFPQVLLEAMASGLPIVATDVPGNKDAIIDGKNGFLVPVKDIQKLAESIILLIKNRELYKTISNFSLEFSKRYDYSEIA